MRLPYADVRLAIAMFVAVSACSPTDATDPNGLRSAGPLKHLTDAGCGANVASLVFSAYPSQIEVGQQSVFYVSFLGADGVSVSAVPLTWTIADTTILANSFDDASGRPAGLGKRAGSTTVTANCGGITASLTITVGGGTPGDTPATSPTTVQVTIPTGTIAPGQTTQAQVQVTDATGQNVVASDTAWSTSNAGVASVTDGGVVTGISGGTTTVTASVEGASGGAALVVSAPPTSPTPPPTTPVDPGSGVVAVNPELPRTQVDARYVQPTGRTINVPAGGDLQGAINSAERGDVILLTPGATYTGPFDLPAKSGSGWITIRTAGAIPGEGQRITPAYASQMPTLVGGGANAPVLRTKAGASGYRIVGVEITALSWVVNLSSLVDLGEGGYYQTSLSTVPSSIVLDRVYVHGQESTNMQRCIALNSAYTAIVNSWISECHGRAMDSQAIAGWNGPGPYLIENNLLEGAGENVMFGGADAAIANLTPSDITLRRNHVRKPPSWQGVWTVKNLFELKHAKRVLVEGNVFENNWAGAQPGMAIVLKSTNQGGTNPWAQTADVTFRYNIVRNSPQGVVISAAPDQYTAAMVAVPAARFRFEHNLFENIGTYNGTTTNAVAVTLTNDLADVTFAHNTVSFNYAEGLFMMLEAWGAARNIVFNDNLVGKARYYQIMHSGIKVGTESMNAFAGSAWSFARNVVVGVGADYVSYHPQSSFYPLATSDVGFSSGANGDYRLSSASPFKGKATDGADPGVNFDELNQWISGVVR